MKKLLFIVFCLLLLIPNLSSKEVLLGKRNVNFKSEKDTIDVTWTEGAFQKIMFKVSGNAVLISKLIITYGNGDKDEIPVKLIFKKGDWSRVIDLEGNNRIIKKIVFFYQTVGKAKKGKAEIAVYGIQKPKGQLLGSKIVNFKSEKDTIDVTWTEGTFTKIAFHVSGNAILISKLVITYGNGDKDDIPVKLIFKKGDWSRVIDLEGNKRIIRKIVFFYQTVGKAKKGKAEIKVFGLH